MGVLLASAIIFPRDLVQMMT